MFGAFSVGDFSPSSVTVYAVLVTDHLHTLMKRKLAILAFYMYQEKNLDFPFRMGCAKCIFTNSLYIMLNTAFFKHPLQHKVLRESLLFFGLIEYVLSGYGVYVRITSRNHHCFIIHSIAVNYE